MKRHARHTACSCHADPHSAQHKADAEHNLAVTWGRACDGLDMLWHVLVSAAHHLVRPAATCAARARMDRAGSWQRGRDGRLEPTQAASAERLRAADERGVLAAHAAVLAERRASKAAAQWLW